MRFNKPIIIIIIIIIIKRGQTSGNNKSYFFVIPYVCNHIFTLVILLVFIFVKIPLTEACIQGQK